MLIGVSSLKPTSSCPMKCKQEASSKCLTWSPSISCINNRQLLASPTQWAWVWANSVRWWRTRKPGMLQSMGSQRVGHDWATEQQQKECKTKNSENFIMIMQGKRECQGKVRFKTSLNSLEGEERWDTEQGTWGHQAPQGGAFDNFQDPERKTVKEALMMKDQAKDKEDLFNAGCHN